MKKRAITILAAFSVLLFCACSNGDTKTAEPREDIASVGDIIIEQEAEETGQEGTETENKDENIDQRTDEKEPVILDFVDVFGEHYQTVVKDDVPKHDYDNEAFVRDGQLLAYEDDSYTSRFGIDVSHHQGEIDWKKVKDAGVTFAILRIGYRGYGQAGLVNADRWFENYIDGAHSQGIDVGVYFFSQAINEEEAAEEADFVLNILNGRALELPVVYDPETIRDDVARTDNVSGEQFTKNALIFTEKIADAGYQPMIYSNMLWEAFEFDLSQLTAYPIWYADYEEFPQTPYYFSMWQYSSTGNISGIQGAVDLDIEFLRK